MQTDLENLAIPVLYFFCRSSSEDFYDEALCVVFGGCHSSLASSGPSTR